MKTLILYRPHSEHERQVLDYMRDFKMQTGKELTTLDVDTAEGIQLCELYDIMQYPAVVVVDDSSHLVHMWTGESLPRIGEVSYYSP